MLFDKSVEAFDTYLKANRGLSENTRKAYRGDVEECLLALERLRCRDLNEVTIEDLLHVDGGIIEKPCEKQHGPKNCGCTWFFRVDA